LDLRVADADQYITARCIEVIDWEGCEEARKKRLLYVASRTLQAQYPKYTIPAAAVYEYANELAIAFNDTNRMQQQGIATFSLTGEYALTFKDWAKSGLEAWIPRTSIMLIEGENGVKIGGNRMKWTVL